MTLASLDGLDIQYDLRTDLPKLWSLASKQLKLAPSQHQEEVFRAILGNCQSVVGNLAAVRNKLGDAHGHGRRPVKPQARHAELAVNLSGSMAGVSGCDMGELETATALTFRPVLTRCPWHGRARAARTAGDGQECEPP